MGDRCAETGAFPAGRAAARDNTRFGIGATPVWPAASCARVGHPGRARARAIGAPPPPPRRSCAASARWRRRCRRFLVEPAAFRSAESRRGARGSRGSLRRRQARPQPPAPPPPRQFRCGLADAIAPGRAAIHRAWRRTSYGRRSAVPRRADAAGARLPASTLRIASSSARRSRVISDSLERGRTPRNCVDQRRSRALIKRAATLAGILFETGNSARDQRIIVSHRIDISLVTSLDQIAPELLHQANFGSRLGLERVSASGSCLHAPDWSTARQPDNRPVPQPPHIFDRLRRQFRPGARRGGLSLPALDRLIHRLDPRLGVLAGRKIVDFPPVQAIADANLDLVEAVEDIELGQRQPVDAAGAHRLAHQHRVEPAAAPRPPGDRAEFAAALADQLRRSRCPARSETAPRRPASCRPCRSRAHSRSRPARGLIRSPPAPRPCWMTVT